MSYDIFRARKRQSSNIFESLFRVLGDYRNGDADCKVVSIQKPDNCDDVVAQLSKSITITARQENQKMNETAAVANMLANRGITVSSVSKYLFIYFSVEFILPNYLFYSV